MRPPARGWTNPQGRDKSSKRGSPRQAGGRTNFRVLPLPGTAKSKKSSTKAAGPGKNAAPKNRQDRAAGTSGPPKPDDRVHRPSNNGPLQEIPSAKANDTRGNRQAYDQARRKTPERREYQRRYAGEQRQRAKLLGKCQKYSKPAIPAQTRCFSCAEQHRQSRRRSYAKRRGMAE